MKTTLCIGCVTVSDDLLPDLVTLSQFVTVTLDVFNLDSF